MSVSIDDVRRAAEQLRGAVVRTPCTHSRKLSAIIGADVFVKYENQQFTSSFKDRGACVKLLSLTDAQRRAGVIAMSAGNHAQGVAYHAQRLGIPATIGMPRGTPNVKVSQTLAFGADVRLEGETVEEAARFAETLQAEGGLSFIHPYDDDRIIAGQGTAALEMFEDAPDIDTLVVPIGGGGLIAGTALVAEARDPAIEVFGVESKLYPSMRQMLRGAPVDCGGQTLAEGIAVKAPGKRTLAIAKRLVRDVLLVSERDIERAICLFLEAERTVAEGAGAAGLAALLADPDRFTGRRIGLILCGGNIDARMLASLLMRALVRDGRIARLRIEISDRPGMLAAVSGLVAETRANILDVVHQRLFPELPAKLADLDMVVETRDQAHVDDIVARLEVAGYTVRLLANAPTGD